MNTSPSSVRPRRTLIVEDEDTDVLIMRLDVRFPGSAGGVTSVKSLAEGAAAIERAKNTGEPFDLALLDFIVEVSPTDLSKTQNTRLAKSIWQWAPRTFVVQMSAYEKDPVLQRDILPESERNPEVYAFVSKATGWFDVLMGTIERGMITQCLREGFEALFPVQRDLSLLRTMNQQRIPGHCAEDRRLEIAALCGEAGKHWVMLARPLQEDLARILGHVTDASGNHIVGVMPPPDFDKIEEIEL